MRCPACGRNLTSVQAGGVTVDACKGGCGGLWFDQLELKRLDESQETGGEALLDIAPDPRVRVDTEQRLHCPKCDDIVMMRTVYDPKSRVVVDHCGNCGGHWLQAGELRAIRSADCSDAERKARLDAVFAERFADHLAELQAQRANSVRGFHPVWSLVRFLFPDYA